MTAEVTRQRAPPSKEGHFFVMIDFIPNQIIINALAVIFRAHGESL